MLNTKEMSANVGKVKPVQDGDVFKTTPVQEGDVFKAT